MKSELIHKIRYLMGSQLSSKQNSILEATINQVFTKCNLPEDSETALIIIQN